MKGDPPSPTMGSPSARWDDDDTVLEQPSSNKKPRRSDNLEEEEANEDISKPTKNPVDDGSGGKFRLAQTFMDDSAWVAFDSTGTLIATAVGNAIIVRKLADFRVYKTLKEEQAFFRIGAVCFHPFKRLLASSSSPPNIPLMFGGRPATNYKIWEIDTGVILLTMSIDDFDIPPELCFSPDGNLLATLNETGVVLWDCTTGRMRKVLTKEDADSEESLPTTLCFDSEGARVIAGTDAGVIVVWDVETGEVVQMKRHGWKRDDHAEDFDGYIGSVCYADRDSYQLVTASGRGVGEADWGGIRFWGENRVGDFELVRTVRAHDKPIWSLAYNHRSNLLVSYSQDQTVKIWILHSEGVSLQQTLKAPTKLTLSVALDKTGQWLAVCVPNGDGQPGVRLYRATY